MRQMAWLCAVLLLSGCTNEDEVFDPADGGGDGDGGGYGDSDTDGDSGADSDGEDGGGGPPGEWVTVAAGTFTMGSPPGEFGREDMDARETQHEVMLTRDFEILATEVTQADFEALLGYNPSIHQGCDDCPVESVTWFEAASYCNALSDSAGLSPCYDCTGINWTVECSFSADYSSPYDCPGYRLPTEAEWEYAARAGTTTATYNGEIGEDGSGESEVVSPIAWYAGNSGGAIHTVGLLVPNDWGLFDMLGNVSEWIHDWYVEDLGSSAATDPFGPGESTWRVIRGGSFGALGKDVRAARRSLGAPAVGFSDPRVGFRPARTFGI